MVAKRRRRGLAVLGVALPAAAFVWLVLLPNYRTQMVRPKVLFVHNSLGQFERDARARRAAGDHLLPETLPDYYTDSFDFGEGAGLETWQVAYADPFDLAKRKGTTMLYCDVRQEGRYNGDPVDFTFRGNKLKYLRLSDTRALLSSYGPDADADLPGVAQHVLEIPTTETAHSVLSRFTYDSTNGTVSDGDIWRMISLD